MRTLYLRNVPDEVVGRLERLTAHDATSVGAIAVRELAEVSRRADNPALLGALPDLHDPAYVALAELLGCAVLTADARLSRAPGLRCPLTLPTHPRASLTSQTRPT